MSIKIALKAETETKNLKKFLVTISMSINIRLKTKIETEAWNIFLLQFWELSCDHYNK